MIAIVNPAAGGGRCGRRAPAALDSLRASLAASGETLEVAVTTACGEASRIAREALARGERRFVAVGGDGTAFEVLNGLFPAAASEREPPLLGFLPLGTGNSFVRDFARDGFAHALQALLGGARRRIDLLRVRHAGGELVALSVVSLGFGAAVAALVNRRLKKLGKLGYTIGVLAEVPRLAARPLRLVVDEGEPRRQPIVLLCACNNQHVGGDMRMAPEARVDDGLLDLVTVGTIGRIELLRTFPRIFAGNHVEHPAVQVERCRAVAFDGGAVDVMVDGESMWLDLDRIEVMPGALDVAL